MNRTPKNRTRVERIVCPVCGATEILDVDPPQRADRILVEGGWHWSRQISEGDDWHLVCPIHYKTPNSRTIYNNAEEDPHPLNLPLIS